MAQPQEPLLLEHVNLNVPSAEKAREFYVALGCTVQPVTTSARQLHLNVGASQFHLLLHASRVVDPPPPVPVTVAQVWPGVIEMWTTEELAELRARMPVAEGPPAIRDDAIGCALGEVTGDASERARGWPRAPTISGGRLLCTCPWGNRYAISPAPATFCLAAMGEHPGGVGGLVAMRRLVHPVRSPGGAAAVRGFLRGVLGFDVAPVDLDPDLRTPRCVLTFASGQALTFVETPDAPPPDACHVDEATHGYHVAIYVGSHEAFTEAFCRAEAARALYANPRFEGGDAAFGNAMVRHVAESAGQFRVRDLADPGDSGVLGLSLEIEVRSPRHRSCPIPAAA